MADLVPTALTASYPELVIDFSGGFFFEAGLVVSWTVENQGPLSAVGIWRDYVYLSPTPTCCDQATLLQVVYGPTPLAAGASYTQEVAVERAIPRPRR